MKRFALIGILAALAAGALVGCSWETGEDASSWSSAFNWVNFSGVYQNTNSAVSTLNIQHTGQHLTCTDNKGMTYSGYISQMRSTSGYENSDIEYVAGDETSQTPTKMTYAESQMPPAGDTIVASFEVSGDGGRIVGVLQGTVSYQNWKSYPPNVISFTRQIIGTLIRGGSVGEINSVAEPINIPNLEVSETTIQPTNSTITILTP